MTAFIYTGNVALNFDYTFKPADTIQGHLTITGAIPPTIPFIATTSVQTAVPARTAALTVTFSTAQAQTLSNFPGSIENAVGTLYGGVDPTLITILDLKSNSTPSSTTSPLTSSSSSITSTSSTGTPSLQSANSQLNSTSDCATLPNATCTDTPQPEQERYDTGQLVGTAVGCVIGGALLATAALFLFLRRRWRNRNDLSEPVGGKSSLNGHGKADYVAGSKAWEPHLPQSESDGTIRAMAERTLDQIEMHVENLYKDATNVHLSPEMQSKITELDSGHLPGPVLSLLPQSNRPTVLIKHCIGNLVISRIAAADATTPSFLPKDFHGLRSSSAAQRKPALTQALSSWRVLTAYLSAEPEHDHAYREQRDQSIADAAQQVNQAFGPWARSTDTERTRSQNLVAIMKRASELGITLFSQPSAFEWQWQPHGQGKVEVSVSHGSTKIVMLPGLYKTSDQDGMEIAPPICVVEPRFGAF